VIEENSWRGERHRMEGERGGRVIEFARWTNLVFRGPRKLGPPINQRVALYLVAAAVALHRRAARGSLTLFH